MLCGIDELLVTMIITVAGQYEWYSHRSYILHTQDWKLSYAYVEHFVPRPHLTPFVLTTHDTNNFCKHANGAFESVKHAGRMPSSSEVNHSRNRSLCKFLAAA